MRRPNTIETPHVNAPERLWKLYIKLGGNCYKTAKFIGVNPSYVWRLLKNGIEPSSHTEKGQAARVKLFLPRYKKVVRKSSPLPLPYYKKKWNQLPAKERDQAIQNYIEQKEQHKHE